MADLFGCHLSPCAARLRVSERTMMLCNSSVEISSLCFSESSHIFQVSGSKSPYFGERFGQILRQAINDLCAPSLFRHPAPVVDLPIHCRIIQTCCNAIQTLLQLNSNNSKYLEVKSALPSCRIAVTCRLRPTDTAQPRSKGVADVTPDGVGERTLP